MAPILFSCAAILIMIMAVLWVSDLQFKFVFRRGEVTRGRITALLWAMAGVAWLGSALGADDRVDTLWFAFAIGCLSWSCWKFYDAGVE